MKKSILKVLLILAGVTAYSCKSEIEPTGPIARFGSPPIIDGTYDPGEWNDALIVRTDTIEQYRIKHDGVNLYIAVQAGGGNLVFNTESGVRVLHWSAQLGSAEYVISDTLTQLLVKPYAFELWGLHNESPSVIQETLAEYLAKNGWAGSTASMGNLMQTELVVSFDWLGVIPGSWRFAEIPGVRISAGPMIARGDPRAEEFLSLSREEMEKLYPFVSWPSQSPARDSIGLGGLPDTINIKAEDYGKIWIDLQK